MGRTPSLPSLAGAEWLAEGTLQRLLAALAAEGGEARVAGGAVRNGLLGEPVTDIDVAATEPPGRVMELAGRAGFDVHPTGLDHGTVTVVAKTDGRTRVFEVTTLRVDVETHGRRATVAFTDDWEADARRRDFTLNALYCDAQGRIFDPVGGYDDLRRRRIRFVGDAQARIREDYLRILRFFRFHARYGAGRPDRKGLQACVALQKGLDRLSAERIRQELMKLLVARGALPALRVMSRTGILGRIVPVDCDVPRIARMAKIESSNRLDPDPVLRLAALAVKTSDDAAVLRSALRLSNHEWERLQLLAEADPPSPAMAEAERRIALYRMGKQTFRDAVRLAWASRRGRFDDRAWADLLALPERWPVPRFPVKGADLARHGIAAGPEMGRLLKSLEEWWVGSGFPPDKQVVLSRLGELRRSAD